MIDVRVPKVGMSTLEVEITEILVTVGQSVTSSDVLMNVAADKIDLEIGAGVDGTVVELLVAEGDVKEVGEIVARIEPA
jgi:pyruvate/2-oxoglutarate dehydrogenase complex dihydrolipoamide acyltransferase (E2) component